MMADGRVGERRVASLSAAVRTREGYDQLYRLHQGRVLRICRLLLRDRAEAEDVTQEVFVAALREWNGRQRPMAWGAWLARVAVNACHRRRRSKWWQWWRGAVDPFPEADFPAEGDPEERAVSSQQRQAILDVFQGLSLRQQEVFVLRHVEGWSTRDVGDALGIDTGTVKRHLFRANQAFRRALGDRT